MHKIKKVVLLLFCFILLMNVFAIEAKALSVSAYSAILIDQDTGRVLYEKRAHEKRRIASITKIMTAILAIESGKLNETVTVSERAVRTEGSSLYLKTGEKIKLQDLVYGLMLRSGNDAAVAIAEHVGGSLEGFVYLMNQKAMELGMRNTHFANPHGLDDSDDHYSSAYDMAILTSYAMKNEAYQIIAGTKVYRAPNPDEKWDRVWRNKNKLLTRLYEHSTGGKTGYTKLAGRTLVSTASLDNMNLVAVTLNAPSDWNDHINLFEYAFDTFENITLVHKGEVIELDDSYYEGKVTIKNSFSYPVKEEEIEDFRVEYRMIEPKKQWERHPEEIPEVVGKAIVYFHEEVIKEVPIYYSAGSRDEETWFELFKGIFTAFVGVNLYG
ncbi:D-alanyl-D-alanine carboxypeptidase [Bacillus oleivorans]|uniref:serine-type D-Ala-D-Ala carboxypeptidase n=1 Tax=Bacillus oleivorans TaxID=1448271 RepID=A0A285CKL8_9BACI|nr:D-alanyl-D-alanine carboxypeptidase family protein [Bacillus oleivorans]SNX68094.1 D-alanyl-D-alanine carboxypeptidase [Bacillus oleivorans]